MQQIALKTAAFVFLLVAIMHTARLLLRAKVTVGKFVVPLWMSVIGIIVSLSLAILMLKAMK